MKAAERSARDVLVERWFKDGVRQVEIGKRLNINAQRVHAILQGRGLLPPPQKTERITTTIWDMEDKTRLRKAIWKRQREGAKAALQAMMEKA